MPDFDSITAPVTRKLKVSQVIGEKTKQVNLKEDFVVPEPKPEIEKIISIDKTVKVDEVKIIDDKVIIDGKIKLQVVYVADEPAQAVHHTEQKFEFTQFVEIPGARPGMTADVKVKVVDVKGKVDHRDPSRFTVTEVLDIFVKVTETQQIDVVVDVPPELEAERRLLKIEQVIAEGEGQAIIGDEFEIPEEKPAVEKILDVDAEITITDKRVIEDKVIIEGELDIQVIYVALEATQPVHHVHQIIEFTQFVEVPGARPGLNVQVHEMITHVAWNIIKPTRIKVEVIVDKLAKVTETVQLQVVTDIKGVDVTKKLLRVESVIGEDTVQVALRETLDIPEAKPGVEKVLSVMVDEIEIEDEDITIINDKVIVEGIIHLQIMYVSEEPDQAVHHVEDEIKFRQFVPVPGAEPDQTVFVRAMVEHVQARIGECHSEIDLDIVLKLFAKVIEVIQLEVVVDFEPEEPPVEPPEKKCLDYIIKKGDTFFTLARRFNTTVEAIQAANPGVNPQNLQIGQVICIPVDKIPKG